MKAKEADIFRLAFKTFAARYAPIAATLSPFYDRVIVSAPTATMMLSPESTVLAVASVPK